MNAPLSASSSAIGDSDSDWDDDDDFVAKKINIKIKPITQTTPGKINAPTDELKAIVGTWKSMGNINLVKPNSRRSQYVQHQQQAPSVPLAPLAPPPLSIPPTPLSIPPTPPPPSIPAPQPPSIPAPQPCHLQQQQLQQHHHQQQPDSYHHHHLLPVALAVQECLNVRTVIGLNGESSTSLIGHVKMAVPRKIIEMNSAQFENNDLILDISTPRAWSEFQLNEEFVRRLPMNGLDEHKPGVINGEFHLSPIDRSLSISSNLGASPSTRNTEKLAVDMKMVYSYSKSLTQHRPVSTYFLLPELLNYKISRSLKRQPGGDLPLSNGTAHLIHDDGQFDQCLNPIEPVAHWLCDLSVTKVRIDLECLEEKLNACGILPGDVKNIKISLRVNGGVESHQSKPPAVWSPIDSKLSWSFSDLNELIQISTHDGVTSCLAKFSLNDGPSTPDDMDIQFSIVGKTLSGTDIMLDENGVHGANNPYLITKRKFEVKTGRFKCEPPHSCPPLLV
uniref:FCH domain only protein 2 n=1 Tax=Aceria tosichella TaxID=561515 RepID=A0A6G1SCD3_9ACAR